MAQENSDTRGNGTVDPKTITIAKSNLGAEASSFADAALTWLQFGFQVVPIAPGEKKSSVKWDPWLSALSPEAIQQHWAKHPDHEVGVIVGDDILVLDADTPQAEAALCSIEEACDVQPNLVVRTKRGTHHYFRLAPGTFAKTDSHNTAEYPDRIDVKHGRTLVVLPPSTGKEVEIDEAGGVDHLTEIDQAFVDAVFRHNGKEAPRKPIPMPPTPKVALTDLDQKMRELNAMLDYIDPDCGYDDWVHLLMAIYHESDGSEDGLAVADAWSSKGHKYAGPAEIEAKWASFAGYQGLPITIATVRKQLADQGIDWQTVCAAAEPGFTPCETEVIYDDMTSTATPATPRSPLEKHSLRGMSPELEKLAVVQVFVLDDIALMGQWTVIYGSPNTGKTLLTLSLLIESIKHGTVDPDRIFYVNMDDSLAGLTQKLRIAEEYHFHMLADGHREFRSSDLRALLFEAINSGSAQGTVVILDTLKKVADLMDKGNATGFGKLARSFIMNGGTLIALAHVNKNRGPNGKPVYAGTSDIIEDADCAYVIDVLGDTDPTEKVVVFENIKRRGDNAQQACYRYSTEPRQSYESLIASVALVDEMQLLTLQKEVELKSDAPVIAALVSAIQDGINTKMKLADTAAVRADCSRRAALKVLEKYTGSDPSRHRWSYEVRDHGAKVFALIPSEAPSP